MQEPHRRAITPNRVLVQGAGQMLVAAAVRMGASWFLSYDRNSRQRPLAGAAGLRVWPPLDKDERGLPRLSAS
jgi:hypothetical protein